MSNHSLRKPTQLQEVDLENLRKICQEYIDFVDNDEEFHEDNDYDNSIFEVAMSTFFGENVWEFINNRKYRDEDEF